MNGTVAMQNVFISLNDSEVLEPPNIETVICTKGQWMIDKCPLSNISNVYSNNHNG